MKKNNIRAFFAIPVTHLKLNHYLYEIKNHFSEKKLRWTDMKHLHITLQFIPELMIRDFPKLTTLAKSNLKYIKSFRVKLDRYQLFPNPDHPKILSVHISPETHLEYLSQVLGEILTECGYAIETRPYLPHVTLCKFNADRIHVHELPTDAFEMISLSIKKVTLFESKPHMHGSTYIPLANFYLN